MAAPERSETEFAPPMGEGFPIGIESPVVRRANGQLRVMSRSGLNAEIPLGELGTHSVKNVRFHVLRDAIAQGEVRALIRQEVSEHKTELVAGTVAVGVVLTGLAAIRYARKSGR